MKTLEVIPFVSYLSNERIVCGGNYTVWCCLPATPGMTKEDCVRNVRLNLCLVMFVFVLSGCGYIAEQYRVEPVINRKPAGASYYINDGKTIDLTHKDFVDKIDSVATIQERNAIIEEIMTLSDNECEIHKSFIISNSNTWNVTTGTLTNIFSGLGTFVGGEHAKSVLAAGAALSNSTRSLVNEEVYVKALATSILSAIDTRRKSISDAINTNKRLPIGKYSVWDGIEELESYHHACSFSNAVTELAGAMKNRKESKFDLKSRINEIEVEIARNKKINANYDPKNLMADMELLQRKLSSAPE